MSFKCAVNYFNSEQIIDVNCDENNNNHGNKNISSSIVAKLWNRSWLKKFLNETLAKGNNANSKFKNRIASKAPRYSGREIFKNIIPCALYRTKIAQTLTVTNDLIIFKWRSGEPVSQQRKKGTSVGMSTGIIFSLSVHSVCDYEQHRIAQFKSDS